MPDSAWERKTESLERTSTCAVSKSGERAASAACSAVCPLQAARSPFGFALTAPSRLLQDPQPWLPVPPLCNVLLRTS
jgi:hypothetical protein